MEKVWSTAELPSKDRLSYWVDAICDTFVHLDCTPQSDAPFFGEIRDVPVGVLRIGTVTSVAQTVFRSPRQIARAPKEICFLAIQESGRSYVTQDGREAELRPGDIAFFDSTRPHSLTFDGSFRQHVLHMPRPSVMQCLGRSEPFTAIRIDGGIGMGSLLAPLLRDLPSSLPRIPAAIHQRISENLLNLVATALMSVDDTMPISAAQTLARVKLWIEAHLGEALSAERIAGACKISVRHLNRLFAGEGTSLMAHVWERRLRRCHRELTSPTTRRSSIGEIAFAAGFLDLSHFSRAYRTRFGCTPREARAAAQQEAEARSIESPGGEEQP
jgi:AraC-like DNA-binding protein